MRFQGDHLNKDIINKYFKKDLMSLIDTNHQINMTSNHSVSSNNTFKSHLNAKRCIGYANPCTKLYTELNTLWVKQATHQKAESLRGAPLSKLDNTVKSNSIFNTNYANIYCA